MTDWLGIQGEKDDDVFLARLRDLPKGAYPDPRYPYLFVVSWSYDSEDETKLPDDQFYAKVDEFERGGVAALECSQLGMMVYSETSQGGVDIFLYVSDVRKTCDLLNECFAAEEPVEFSEVEDAGWGEYEKFRTRANLPEN